METYRLVLSEDLNQYGYLFGGRLLAWVDEASWIAASLEFPCCRFLTVGMDKVAFRHAVKKGEIIAIQSTLEKKGTSSVRYRVEVFRGKAQKREILFSTLVSFVHVDEEGKKAPIPFLEKEE